MKTADINTPIDPATGLPDLDPYFRAVTGRTAVAQALLRRLVTPRGGLLGEPLYGLDVRAWTNDTIDARALRALETAAATQLRRDERVDDVSLVATFADDVLRLVGRVRLVGDTTPLRLTLAIAAVTAEVIAAELA